MCYEAIPNIGDRAAHRYWSIPFTINPSGRELWNAKGEFL